MSASCDSYFQKLKISHPVTKSSLHHNIMWVWLMHLKKNKNALRAASERIYYDDLILYRVCLMNFILELSDNTIILVESTPFYDQLLHKILVSYLNSLWMHQYTGYEWIQMKWWNQLNLILQDQTLLIEKEIFDQSWNKVQIFER